MFTSEYFRHCYFTIYDFLNDEFIGYYNDVNELKEFCPLRLRDISYKFNYSINDYIVFNRDNKLYKLYAFYDIDNFN